MSFALHPRLAADTALIADLELSRALLMNDRRYPWVVLVPRVPDAREVHRLDPETQTLLWRETTDVASALDTLYGPDKMNIGAIGNLVPQLHVHVVARRADDATWPQPVWGVGEAEPYGEAALAARMAEIRERLMP